ncbi:MAG: RnfABCDGE type electron transport complex subunit G [Paludibacteraceae bacterium]|nr:RnfABCDGE type electron transport complex subunit G [Paludibacteraceae bacterium]
MEKLESSFKNMLLSLVTICVVAATALAGIYLLTKDQIQKQQQEKQQQAILNVLPAGVEIAAPETIDGMVIYRATLNGEAAGAAVETSAMGFGGEQKIIVGFDKEGKIFNYEVLEHQETPGLGDHIVEWFKNADKPGQNIIGRQATGDFRVSKGDGGDIDAITAATISSRAFLKAINQAYNAYAKSGVEAQSGATEQVESDIEEETEVKND